MLWFWLLSWLQLLGVLGVGKCRFFGGEAGVCCFVGCPTYRTSEGFERNWKRCLFRSGPITD